MMIRGMKLLKPMRLVNARLAIGNKFLSTQIGEDQDATNVHFKGKIYIKLHY